MNQYKIEAETGQHIDGPNFAEHTIDH